ncbi:MAG: hypothetical protein O7G88_20285 [bacterium]|nr:hypothetical protein [bacterium]
MPTCCSASLDTNETKGRLIDVIAAVRHEVLNERDYRESQLRRIQGQPDEWGELVSPRTDAFTGVIEV